MLCFSNKWHFGKVHIMVKLDYNDHSYSKFNEQKIDHFTTVMFTVITRHSYIKLIWMMSWCNLKSILRWEQGVNFINVLRTNFLYEHCFGSFFLLRFDFEEKFVRKIRTFNVDEIDEGVSHIQSKTIRCLNAHTDDNV
jgi:hypothetical protein